MNLNDILQLMDRFESSSIAELEVSLGSDRLSLKKAAPVSAASSLPAAPAISAPAAQPAESLPKTAETVLPAAEGTLVKAPLVGTFYRAASPESKPFVSVGDRVSKGQTVCLIEAMKMMNEISAPADGEVVEIIAQNGDIVAFDTPLLRIKE